MSVLAWLYMDEAQSRQLWGDLRLDPARQAEVVRAIFQQGYFLGFARQVAESGPSREVFDVLVEHLAADPLNHWLWQHAPSMRMLRFYYPEFERDYDKLV
jgi:hypothetical protein